MKMFHHLPDTRDCLGLLVWRCQRSVVSLTLKTREFLSLFIVWKPEPKKSCNFPKSHSTDEKSLVDFPGGPVVKTLRFHCRGHGFDPWSGN